MTPVPSDESYIYNNTVYLDAAKCKPDIEIFAEDTYIYNNIFYAMNGAQIGAGGVNIEMQNGGELKVSNNLFYGDVASSFSDLDRNKIVGNPQFVNAVSTNGNMSGFDVKETSEAIDKGKRFTEPEFPMAGQGIFKDFTLVASEDAFGNTIDIQNVFPNIGASDAHNSNISTGIESLKQVQTIFQIYPNPVNEAMSVNLDNSSEDINLTIYSISGKVVDVVAENSTFQKLQILFPASVKNGIYFIRITQGDNFQTERFILYR